MKEFSLNPQAELSRELSDKKIKEAARILFDCDPSEIAWKKEEVNQKTKAYIGPLSAGIFKTLSHLEHIYTSFPEGRITQYNIEIGGQTAEQLEAALERAGIQMSPHARQIMKHKDFKTAQDPEQADLLLLRVGDLFGDQDSHTTDEIHEKAEELGLELCPAEVGPHLRLKPMDQPVGDRFHIAMKEIPAPDDRLSVFSLGHNEDDGLWLRSSWTEPTDEWYPKRKFVFRLRR